MYESRGEISGDCTSWDDPCVKWNQLWGMNTVDGCPRITMKGKEKKIYKFKEFENYKSWDNHQFRAWSTSRSLPLSIPNSLTKELHCSPTKGFVKTSAIWFEVMTNFNSISPLVMWSQIKRCFTSTCLVWECTMDFLAKFIALVFSY